MDTIFLQLGLILLAATLVGLLCHRLKQPLFFAYLLTGIVAGIIGTNHLPTFSTFHFLADLGIAFLLFLVGLELNISAMRRLGTTVFLTALGQVATVASVSYILAILFGFPTIAAGYIALALTFSSTIIVVKHINDEHATYALHGRLSLGILITQDALALAALIILSSIGVQSQHNFGWLDVLLMLTKGATLIVAHIYLSRNLLPPMFRWLAGSTDLLLLGSIGWCILGAASAQALGFPVEIGAFLAGLSLSASSYQYQIAARIKPIRDFFVSLFFIVLGLQMAISNLMQIIVPTLIFGLIAAIGTPLVVATLLSRFGYKRHTAFFTAIPLGQAGEFALVLAALGLSSHQLTASQASLISTVVLFSIIISSFAIKHQEWLYRQLRPLLVHLERSTKRGERRANTVWRDHVVVLGASYFGTEILSMLRRLDAPAVVVEYDPQRITALDGAGHPTIFGDATDESVLEEAGATKSRLIVSSIDQHQANLALLRWHRHQAPHIPLIVTAATIDEALVYYRLGAAFVIMPVLLGNRAVAQMVKEHWQNLDELYLAKLLHLQHLAARGPAS